MVSATRPWAASSKLLVALTSAIATTACVEPEDDGRERVSENVSYQPGRNATRGGDPMPPLPCLPAEDARIHTLTSNCSAKDFRVVSGPVATTDDFGTTVCAYVLTYTTPRGASCIVGRPLVDAVGKARTAKLRANAAWSV